MNTVGTFTSYIDLAQVVLYGFWAFFAFLIFYLVRENHREGYPMEAQGLGRPIVSGWPIPEPKTFLLEGGRSVTVPELHKPEPPIVATPTGGAAGMPLQPDGDTMLSGIGPGSYALRADEPDRTLHGDPLIRPLRVATDFSVAPQDTDPRGLPVIGGDGKPGGVVSDLWVDSAEMMFRYLEVETQVAGGTRRVLLPIPFARIRRNQIEVHAIYSYHFGQVPTTRSPDEVTMLEEEKIAAYYGGGKLYADPERAEPLV
jgi:photosynthetic reaction center H subunit